MERILRHPGVSRFRPLIALAAWYLALGLALRLLLWWQFGRPQQVGALALAWIVPAGVVADVVQSLYLLAPFACFLWLLPQRSWRGSGVRLLLPAGAFLWMALLIFASAAEYFFFEEFDARFNLVSVDYLVYPTEVIGDIRAEYPVYAVIAAAALAAAASVFALRRQLAPCGQSTLRARTGGFGIFALALSTAFGAYATDSLARSSHRIANELAANGASSFFRALRTSEIDYHALYASADPRANFRILVRDLGRGGGRFVRLDARRLDREFSADAHGFGRLNVVVVVSESFGAEFSRLYGSDRDWTPEFDAFARKGLWFSSMYASGTRTVRGLEAIVASFPPIPSVSIVRRPGSEGIANWGKVMRERGYRTAFLYGGYGYFDNMNHFFESNGFEVLDRNSIPQPVRFENVWGVADEDLYDFALDRFDAMHAAGAPFFAVVMSTSNHKPFTFREGVPGVQPAGGGRESGVRYADFAQGRFLRAAGSHRWFDDTLFVLVADHGARVYGRQEIPLESYEIPMLFYAPKHLPPGRVDTLTTQVDIAPTVLGLLGMRYTAPFFGTDVLHAAAAPHVAFFSHNHDVALYRDGELAILGLHRSIRNLHYDRGAHRYSAAPPNRSLNALAIAYYQTAAELFRAHRYE